jgi:C1A family cysteine protease
MVNFFTAIRNWFKPSVINDPKTLISMKSLSGANINFGYLEHNDIITQIPKSNISFAASPLSSEPLQSEVSVRKFFKSISSQSRLGSCVANATADAVEAEQIRSRNISPEKLDDISRLFIYWNARNNQSPPAGNVDKGTYISLGFDVIKRYGCPPERFWPYDVNKVFTRPSPVSYAQAYGIKVNKYYSINSSGDDRVADVIRALSSGRGVVFGTKINDAFRAVKGKQIISPPSGGYIGGHAMVFTAWIGSENVFEVRNSWGEDWGDMGYTYFTPEYVKASITHDLFVATL